MGLREFIDMYRDGNNSSIARQLGVDRATIGRWVLAGDYTVTHKGKRMVAVKRTQTIWASEEYR